MISNITTYWHQILSWLMILNMGRIFWYCNNIFSNAFVSSNFLINTYYIIYVFFYLFCCLYNDHNIRDFSSCYNTSQEEFLTGVSNYFNFFIPMIFIFVAWLWSWQYWWHEHNNNLGYYCLTQSSYFDSSKSTMKIIEDDII